jgi:hypothetical protein
LELGLNGIFFGLNGIDFFWIFWIFIFGYILIRIDVRILQISLIGTDFFWKNAGVLRKK